MVIEIIKLLVKKNETKSEKIPIENLSEVVMGVTESD